MAEYTGLIIEESLEDSRILNELNIIGVEITDEDNEDERWHIYTVLVPEEEIDRFSDLIKPRWYMHFWNDRDVVAIFKGKKFEFNYDDKSTWKDVVDYGLSLGIAEEQLDFPID